MLLDPKTAAKLSSALFPDEEPDQALFSLLGWFDEYLEARGGAIRSPAPAVRPTPLRSALPSAPTKSTWTRSQEEEDNGTTGELLPLTPGNIRSNPQLKHMMDELLAYTKANKMTASDIAREVGASYPTILNWQRGKLPRGENIGKVEAFLVRARKAK
jgi:hypothetical protein